MSEWVRPRPEGGFVYGDSRGVQGRAATREEAEHRAAQLVRRYALVKVARGDYLLPSNDQQKLWRISTYDEDGSAEWYDPVTHRHGALRGTFWQTAKYIDPLPSNGDMPDDFLEWERWETYETCLSTRQKAIESALKATTTKGAPR